MSSLFADQKERAKWWVLNAGALMDIMRLVYIGEDPELLYIELVANASSGRAADTGGRE